MNNLVTLQIFADDYTPLKSWQLARWCRRQGADEWAVQTITTDKLNTEFANRFDEVLAPFRLPDSRRRHLTALHNESFVRAGARWKLTSAALAALQEFLADGLFTYQPITDDWLEDFTLYRQGELMLGIVSHEAEGVLRVVGEERRLLEQSGFPFRVSGVCVGY